MTNGDMQFCPKDPSGNFSSLKEPNNRLTLYCIPHNPCNPVNRGLSCLLIRFFYPFDQIFIDHLLIFHFYAMRTHGIPTAGSNYIS